MVTRMCRVHVCVQTIVFKVTKLNKIRKNTKRELTFDIQKGCLIVGKHAV